MLQVFLFMIKFILIFDHFVVVPVFNYLFTFLLLVFHSWRLICFKWNQNAPESRENSFIFPWKRPISNYKHPFDPLLKYWWWNNEKTSQIMEDLTNNCSLWFTTEAFFIISFPFLIWFFCRKTLKTCTTMLNLNPDLRRRPQQTLWRMTPLHPSGSKTQDEVSAGIIKYPVMLNLSRPRWIYQNINNNKKSQGLM